MSEVNASILYERVCKDPEKCAELVEAAAMVANAIASGAAGFIRFTQMETDLRKALCMKEGETVVLPNPARYIESALSASS